MRRPGRARGCAIAGSPLSDSPSSICRVRADRDELDASAAARQKELTGICVRRTRCCCKTPCRTRTRSATLPASVRLPPRRPAGNSRDPKSNIVVRTSRSWTLNQIPPCHAICMMPGSRYRMHRQGQGGRGRPSPSSVSVGLADCSQVDMLRVWYKPVNLVLKIS